MRQVGNLPRIIAWCTVNKTLNKACYAIISYVHSLISYGIIFWGNSSHSEEILKIHKRIIRIIMNSSKNASCWQLFREFNILPIQFQYIFSILLFVTKSKDQFLSNSPVHKINTRQTSVLYVPTANLAIYLKGVCYSGIKIYNHLPTAIKIYLVIRINSN